MKIDELDKFNCDLCHSSVFNKEDDIKNKIGMNTAQYDIVKCQRCGLTALFPHPTQQEISNFYSDYNSKKDRVKVETLRQQIIYPNKLVKLQKYANGNRLLDIGAGLGGFLFLAKQQGFDITGIELSSEQCKIAKEKFNIDLLNADIFELKEDIDKFDVIHLHHVLEHLTSPSMMFDAVNQLLTENGILLIEVPYQLKRIQDPIKKHRKKNMEFNFDHLFFFSPNTMKKYIRKYGLEIIEFNQHRYQKIEKRPLNFVEIYAKYFFYKMTDKFWIPSGGFLEFYCRKK